MPNVPQQVIDMRRGPHPSDLKAIKLVRRYLAQHGPFDVIHGHSSKGGAIARLAGIAGPAATVYTPHAFVTMDPVLSARSRFIYGNIERVLGWFSSSIIALTGDEKSAIERVGIASHRVGIVPNSIGPPDFLPREAARRQLRLPERGVVIGFVGRLCHQKDPQLLIRAFAEFVDLPEMPILGIIGDGPLQAELETLVSTLGLEGKVHLLGRQPAAELMRAFDIYAMSSLYEGMPYVLLEALAAGLPIVSTVVSSSDELIENEVNGLLVTERTPAALGAALRRLIVDRELRQRFSAAAQQRSAGFTLNEMVEKTVALYRRLLRQDSPETTIDESSPENEHMRRPVSTAMETTHVLSDGEPSC